MTTLETLTPTESTSSTNYRRRARILWRIAQVAMERAKAADQALAEERALREMVEAENAELRRALAAQNAEIDALWR